MLNRLKWQLLLPSNSRWRSHQCFVLLLLLWMCFCYVFYQIWRQRVDVLLQENNRFPHHAQPMQSLSEEEISEQSRIISSGNENSITDYTNVRDRQQTSEVEELSSIQRRALNLPYDIWMKYSAKLKGTRPKCAYFPNVFEMKFNNIYWQMHYSSNGTFYLYGAYHDNRPTIQQRSIRILGMINRIEPNVSTYCLLWYEVGKDPVKTPVVEFKYIWNKKWGNYKQGPLQPYLMTCLLPKPQELVALGFRSHQIPISVSLTEQGCEPPTNNLRVINNVPAKKGRFAVCVKGLDFLDDDRSIRLIEWIELLGVLGAEKIFLYELEVHPNTSKVLDYYEKTGQIDRTVITLAGEQPNLFGFRHKYLKAKVTNKRQSELIPYNDCLYRNLYSYDYIAVLDTDEIILPKDGQTWPELIDVVKSKALADSDSNRASYFFRNVYFWDDDTLSHNLEPGIPPYMHMLHHVYRSANYTKPRQYVKCFHDVQLVLTLHNHFPFACVDGRKCTSYGVDIETAHLQHYRADCVASLKKTCSEYKEHLVKDTTIWSYNDDLIHRVSKVLHDLGFV